MTAVEHRNADMVQLILNLGVVNPSAFVDKRDPALLNYSRAPLMALSEKPQDEPRVWKITQLLINAKANTDNIDSDGASLQLAQVFFLSVSFVIFCASWRNSWQPKILRSWWTF